MPPRRKKASNQAPVIAQGTADTAMEESGGEAVAQEADLKCPGCKDGDEDSNKDIWICCDACKTWYHWVCSGIEAHANSQTTGESGHSLTPEQIDKWYCNSCVEQDASRTMTLKPPPRKSGRKKVHVDMNGSDTVMAEAQPAPVTEPPATAGEAAAPAVNVTNPAPTSTPTPTTTAVAAVAVAVAATTTTTTVSPPLPPPPPPQNPPEVNKWIAIAESKTYSPDNFRRMNGSDIGMEWILRDENAMKEPIVIETPEGLGMKMPPKEMTVRDVANEVGPDTHVEVIDVQTQSNCPGWTLGKWADYYHSDPNERDKIRNVISLEVSGTPLGAKILPPRLVRELDWVEKHWPHNKKQLGHYPKVQLYCLMSVAQCWTDWHIDFAGSSVYYHILHGSKVFYFIKPTAANLAAYEHWSGTDIQNHTWMGDMADEVVRVELTAGNTMIIPTGWIHAVYTPADTLVFGGNFLHSLNMKTQLRVRDIEIRTRVPKKFRFPLFTKLCWYVGEKYCKDLKAKEEFSPRVLKSLDALAGFLVSEARTIERGSEMAKKEAKENVPMDRIKDASLLARELRWRVRSAAGVDSDTELGGDGDDIVPVKREPGSSRQGVRKRKDDHSTPLFKNWQPPEWISVENLPLEVIHDTVKVEDVEKEDGWMAREGISGDVMRSTKKNGITKIRKLDQGAIERYSVVRTVEIVTPSGAKKEPL